MAQQARSSARQRPDVIMIIADQWRGQDQGWNGNREVITPRSDALARDGVAISGAIANHPVCGPGPTSRGRQRFPDAGKRCDRW
jgi:arylsulfatase A-like enzyme